ncbi:HNH endonuclease [Streptacidiphilus sp. N1-3]|uniref:HNH endonuclease n=1 Tax=Streptacidiphilus alkalitolerans TaxID=3342712 RepID=A0ABV6X171_9ACTN
MTDSSGFLGGAAGDFYRAAPAPVTAWRAAVLMGPQSHTGRFALAGALLELAAEGRTEVGLDELAAHYAAGLLRHLPEAPQAAAGGSPAVADFLAVVARESEGSAALGRPTEELRQAAVRALPAQALQKFHSPGGGGADLPHRFFEFLQGDGEPSERVVRLAPELLALATGEQAPGLRAELDARWGIVESSFDPAAGRGLNEQGLSVDWHTVSLTDASGQRPVAGLTAALIGFQHGRCQLCDDTLDPGDPTAVDRLFPRSLSDRAPAWRGPDLDGLWNLAPAHADCVEAKGDRLPGAAELQRLARRNEAVMQSPIPLRRTLQRPLQRARLHGEHQDRWPTFLLQVFTAGR